jgi:hypothetical protein
MKLHIAKVGSTVRTAFVSSKQPASLRKEEKATNLLSHFGKSATEGLVKIKGKGREAFDQHMSIFPSKY